MRRKGKDQDTRTTTLTNVESDEDSVLARVAGDEAPTGTSGAACECYEPGRVRPLLLPLLKVSVTLVSGPQYCRDS